MSSLARGLAVIRAFSQQQRDVGVAQISAQIGTQAARVPIRELEGRILPQLRAVAADLGLLPAASP